MTSYTLEEIEAERQEALKDMIPRNGPSLPDISARYLNEVGYREAFHSSWIFYENVQQYLQKHPCVILDHEAWNLAHKAATALFNLYQCLGSLEYQSLKRDE